jgi:hypothetical protein
MRFENEKYKSKCLELEKWVLLFTNNFYEGNPTAITTIEQTL